MPQVKFGEGGGVNSYCGRERCVEETGVFDSYYGGERGV